MARYGRKAALLSLLAIGLVALSACAHQELMAPCTRDSWLAFGSAYADDCGPLRPINR